MSLRRAFSALAPALVAACAALPALAVDHPVTANEDLTFTPEVLVIDPGDTVTWSNAGGLHNVVADDDAFRCADGCDGVGDGNGDASSDPWSFTLLFPDPGDVGYFCEVHGGAGGIGMAGMVIVALFRDGFETGDTTRWSATVGAPTNDLAPASRAAADHRPGLSRPRPASATAGLAKHCTGEAGASTPAGE